LAAALATGCNFLAAGLVGGIHANSAYPADFIADNMAIALNVIHAARNWRQKACCTRLFLHLPKFASQPMSEDALLTDPLEPTTNGMPLQRSQRLSSVKPIANSIEMISSR
jgi:GDP-L-fucose synthase